MQSAITVLTVIGGLLFSISCALLVEELIFGGLFKIFFKPKQGRAWFIGGADRPVPVPVEIKFNRKLKKH